MIGNSGRKSMDLTSRGSNHATWIHLKNIISKSCKIIWNKIELTISGQICLTHSLNHHQRTQMLVSIYQDDLGGGVSTEDQGGHVNSTCWDLPLSLVTWLLHVAMLWFEHLQNRNRGNWGSFRLTLMKGCCGMALCRSFLNDLQKAHYSPPYVLCESPCWECYGTDMTFSLQWQWELNQ